MTFEAALARLEAIVSGLQEEEIPLDRALALFEEGLQCLKAAHAELSRAEAQVKLLVEKADGTFELPDFRG
jgi:exodeoxyribonuclease VII small subunit